MGSVPDLYTTGDNDPEIDPVSYYRHYLYCDACGAFDLGAWIVPDHHEGIERTRRRLAKGALIASLLALVAGWVALDLVLFPALLLVVAAGVIVALMLREVFRSGQDSFLVAQWRALKVILLFLLPSVLVADWIATVLVPPVVALVAGLVILVGLLVVRGVLGSKIQSVGMRCRRCGATYAYGTPFFTDLDANPRHLAVADVPRPLGSSPFLSGKSVETTPPEPGHRLPP